MEISDDFINVHITVAITLRTDGIIHRTSVSLYAVALPNVEGVAQRL